MNKCLNCNKKLNCNAKRFGTKRCHSCAMKKRFRIKENHPMFGRIWTEEEKAKHRKDCLGNNKGKKLAKWQIEYLRSIHLGTKASVETRKKRSASMLARREQHWNWKGGVWNKNNQVRKSLEIKLWREAVFKRDDFTCRECGKRGCYLNAHHIKKFSDHPNLRFAIDNGLTLCRDCHYKIPTR